ncbi:kinesin-like protein KIF20A [Rhincodon typus]|uniref:kinesin-like protein KIF20A n=1 Tax=Rhincodon typus TaxID=259920 RepID=UPI00202EA2C4|nr:kinesin-like protein KIF20A [Rhincodon typus]
MIHVLAQIYIAAHVALSCFSCTLRETIRKYLRWFHSAERPSRLIPILIGLRVHGGFTSLWLLLAQTSVNHYKRNITFTGKTNNITKRCNSGRGISSNAFRGQGTGSFFISVLKRTKLTSRREAGGGIGFALSGGQLEVQREAAAGSRTRDSQLILCDLAGSERCKEQKCGDRMKEATNINTSLHTLGRCIRALRQNQHNKSKPNMVPFRDSKLTRVFQGFFSNHGMSCMIVNINQCASMYDETLQVMKFSAIASQLIQAPSSKLFPSFRALLREHDGWNNCNAQAPLEEQEELDDDEDDGEDEMDISALDKESLQKIIESLQQHLIKEKQDKLIMESEIRQSVVSEMMEQYNTMERHWREQFEEQKDRLEDAFEAKMKNYQEYVKIYYQLSSEEEDCDDSGDEISEGKVMSRKIRELEATIHQLKAERKSSSQSTRQSARLANTKLSDELHNLKLELANVKTELEQSKAEAAFSAEELKRYKEMIELPAGMKHLTVDADRKIEAGQRNAKALQNELQKIGEALQVSERACCHNTAAENLRRTLAKCEDLIVKQDQTLADLQKLLIMVKLDLKKKNTCIAEQYHTVRQLQAGPGCNKRRCAGNIENQPPPWKKPFLTSLLTPSRLAQHQGTNTPSNYILRSRARMDKVLHLSSAKYQ